MRYDADLVLDMYRNGNIRDAHRDDKGFTIVELLVVIVVIAILAAFTIVAFNGVQSRAESSRFAGAIDAYIKSFETFYAANGAYPNFGSGCLGVGSDYPASGYFTQNACVMASGTTSSTYNASLNQALSAQIANPPSTKLAPVRVDYGGGMIYDYRGAWVETGGTYYQFQFWLVGNQKCIKGTSSYNASANATRCSVYWGAFS